MRGKRRESESGPLTLRQAIAVHLRLIVWCKACQHKVEFGEAEIADQAARHGATLSVIDWAKRLRCSACGNGDADFVVSGYKG
jgi:hypothetical protein